MSSTARHPAVAGYFYPADPVVLQATVASLLAAGDSACASRPRALIVPHAGYVYSGGVAASAYRTLADWADQYRRVVLIGPSHRVPFSGMAVPSVAAFETPLGSIALDRTAIADLLSLPEVVEADRPHADEHSLEVQLPFLQRVLSEFLLVPIAVGDASAMQVEAVMDRLIDDATLLVVSTDLSHYLSYPEANRVDRATLQHIAAGEPQLRGEQACGCRGVNGLVRLARRRDWRQSLLAYRNSGDTAGDRDRVVGYAALVYHDG